MEELDHTLQEKLFISAYWPQRTADELNVGYGVAKDYLVYQGVGIVFTLVNKIFRFFFEPKIRYQRSWLRLVPALLMQLGTTLLIVRQKSRLGFYQLDAQGTPTFLIGTFPPESVQGRLGVSRKKFLQYNLENK